MNDKFDLQPEALVRADELVALIAQQAVTVGATRSKWPGLTFYRFEQKISPHWDEVGSLSLCVVAQGRKRVRIGSIDYFYDPFHYLVMTRDLRFQAEILQGSAEQPFLSFVLQMPCEVVTEVHTTLKDSQPASYRYEPLPLKSEAFVTALDQDLLGAVRRFLLSLKSESERKVLAPMYLRETIYRLLRAEQHLRLLESAADELGDSTITASIHFMRQEMHQRLTIRELAEAVSMSESSFAHSFKAVTGLPPLQFLKQIRLERARKLLLSGNNVSETAAKVSYTSLSHFIFEFKRQFGEPPKTYVKRFQNLQESSSTPSVNHLERI